MENNKIKLNLDGWGFLRQLLIKCWRRNWNMGNISCRWYSVLLGLTENPFEILTCYPREHRKGLLSGEDPWHMSGRKMRVRWMKGVHWHVESSVSLLYLLTEQKQAVDPTLMAHVTKMRFSLVQGGLRMRLKALAGVKYTDILMGRDTVPSGI